MKVGNFDINSYLEKLYESAEEGNLKEKEGIIIPEENKKTYDWLKKEYQAGQTEVKVEIKGQGSSFSPGYDLQSNTNSVNEFKPGIFGDAKGTNGQSISNKNNNKPALDDKKDSSTFQKGEGEDDKIKNNNVKTNVNNKNINNKEENKDNNKISIEKKNTKIEEKNPGVKKIDLRTKK
ncbi:hypothetical protein M0Q50_10345 [bacterium]|jgi:hypothetical protein|nr:hypothetical protein [bacterium]